MKTLSCLDVVNTTICWRNIKMKVEEYDDESNTCIDEEQFKTCQR